MKRRLSLFFIFLFALGAARSVHAAATAWQTNPHGRVRLISAFNSAPQNGVILLGLHFEPQPGWYLYWKDPGEAGIPPKVIWDKTQGLSNPKILFPQPVKMILPGNIIEYGYDGPVVYPIPASVSGNKIAIAAKVSYLTCNTSCVPYTYTFHLELPTSNLPEVDENTAPLIQSFLSQVPADELNDEQVKAKALVHRKTPGEPLISFSVFFGMLLVAFLGGVILNVMPCVLPVLSIKLTGLLQHSGQSQSRVAQSALASAAGILVSFLGFAFAAIFARQAGHAVGWGIQFQNPIFVTFLLMVVLLFAFNLWGIFEINMPLVIGKFATSYGFHETLTAHFMSGLFATLLATPCSAPFLGTAMGFALSQPSGTILSIFLAVGTGMALPYLLLAVFPQSVRWLPKPGSWMIGLKKGMALLLLVTASWLGWVLYQQLKSPLRDQSGHSVGGEGDFSWVAFDESAIDRYMNEGKSVFVDVTADWCVTCKYNERLVLGDTQVKAEFKRRGVIMMKADWTNRNPIIDAYLMKNGRAGIPFYAFYTPHQPPVTLSEFLTKKKILDALQVPSNP